MHGYLNVKLLQLFADTAAISQLPANDKERIYERKSCQVTAMSINTGEHSQSAKSCYFSDILCEIRISKMWDKLYRKGKREVNKEKWCTVERKEE